MWLNKITKKIGKEILKNSKLGISEPSSNSKIVKVVKAIIDSKPEFSADSLIIRRRYHRIREQFYEKNSTLVKPILIVGVPHSGTSVLSSTFKNHPDIAMWTEAPEVWEPSWAEGVDSEYNRLVPMNEDDVTEMDIQRVTDAFFRYLKSQNKSRLMNKNPRNTVRINYMRKIFPDAKIIHIYRDGREVVNSITRSMSEFMIEQICDRWVNSINEFKKQSEKIPNSDIYEIRYEKFCESPRKIIAEAYQMCELRVDEKILNIIPTKFTNFNGKWSKEINEKYHPMIREKLEPTMKELGYQW